MVKEKRFRTTDLADIFSTKYILEPIMMWKNGLFQKNYEFKHRHSLKPGVMEQAKPVPTHKCNRIIPDSKQSMSRNGIPYRGKKKRGKVTNFRR